MTHTDIPTQHIGYALGANLTHTLSGQTSRVKAFGRERDKQGRVVYYWVFDGKRRFKAFPHELKAE